MEGAESLSQAQDDSAVEESLLAELEKLSGKREDGLVTHKDLFDRFEMDPESQGGQRFSARIGKLVSQGKIGVERGGGSDKSFYYPKSAGKRAVQLFNYERETLEVAILMGMLTRTEFRPVTPRVMVARTTSDNVHSIITSFSALKCKGVLEHGGKKGVYKLNPEVDWVVVYEGGNRDKPQFFELIKWLDKASHITSEDVAKYVPPSSPRRVSAKQSGETARTLKAPLAAKILGIKVTPRSAQVPESVKGLVLESLRVRLQQLSLEMESQRGIIQERQECYDRLDTEKREIEAYLATLEAS